MSFKDESMTPSWFKAQKKHPMERPIDSKDQSKESPTQSKLEHRKGAITSRTRLARLCLFLAMTAALIGTVSIYTKDLSRMSSRWNAAWNAPYKVLVLYVYSNTDPEYANNLRFFVKNGIHQGDNCNYVIVIQQIEDEAELQILPTLPSNARYEYHKNGCFDWGTMGWALQTLGIQWQNYKYFIFMNSSARGPFLPSHWPQNIHWTVPLLRRLNRRVKLVGPTISCEGEPLGGDPQNVWRTNPHVQSYALATDQLGLSILKKDNRVFACHKTLHDAIYNAELGSSAAVLRAGYSIDSLMTRYQGVNWRDRKNWHCNSRINPYGEHYNDGISLDPYEVMFVKVKAHMLDLGWSASRKASKYSRWLKGGVLQGINDNEFVANGEFLKLPATLAMAQHGSECFDEAYYARKNADIPAALAEQRGALWNHFVEHGQHEGRPFKFICGHMRRVAEQREADNKASGLVTLTGQAPCSRLFGEEARDFSGYSTPGASCNTTIA